MSEITKATVQAALINAGSNVLAQGIGAYQNDKPFELDTTAVIQFTACAIVSSPLIFLWLNGLEAQFPGTTTTTTKTEKGETQKKTQLNVPNTVAKVVLDQTVGGAWITALFIATMGALRGQDYGLIMEQIKTDFWPIMIAGLKMWPFVSILNFTVVPADQRLLVNSLFGVIWAVYLSLMSG
ncbi:hypothetical protein ASPZODRAFT_19148 [Penicilliopsis zonata CBS 506.65]|uniref:Uncharacterized protein n=1 Tax=Penicilliopsis zonata CBS 506.65 TaxID=1073090 RepID=A0A1L9S9L5_9EURO|nr:hypothetical protein ASPZODRAFT_19148 [Penicilliopsis zonata CBS 506.65]OJJ43846.1 hypothetical protein ASPZODRAFT_19148 [Penicilliopsis zonata CBS 506.65]